MEELGKGVKDLKEIGTDQKDSQRQVTWISWRSQRLSHQLKSTHGPGKGHSTYITEVLFSPQVCLPTNGTRTVPKSLTVESLF